MIFRKCIVCKFKSLKLNVVGNKSKNFNNIYKNSDKYVLNLILSEGNLQILDIFKCRRCKQKTLTTKNLDTKEIKDVWFDYLIRLKSIEKEIFSTEEQIKYLSNSENNKDRLAIQNKIQLLSQDYELYKLQKTNLKYTMMASISIKLQSALL